MSDNSAITCGCEPPVKHRWRTLRAALGNGAAAENAPRWHLATPGAERSEKAGPRGAGARAARPPHLRPLPRLSRAPTPPPLSPPSRHRRRGPRPLSSRPGRSFLLGLIVPNRSARPAPPPPPPRAAPGEGRGGEGVGGGGPALREEAPRRRRPPPGTALPAPDAAAVSSRAPRRPPAPRPDSAPTPALRQQREEEQEPERGARGAGAESETPQRARTASPVREPSPPAQLPRHPPRRPGREHRMRPPPLLLLLLLLLVPSGLGNNEPISSTAAVATTISAESHKTTGKPQTVASPQPTGPSETRKPTTAAIRPTTTLQPTSPALPIVQTTSKPNQEGGDLTTVRGELTTKAPSSTSALSTTLETKKETTVAPTAAPGALGTQAPVLSSLTTGPLPSPSATPKLQEGTTLPDASIPQTTLNPTASTHKSESPPSLTSATPVPGAFPYPVSTGTSVTSRTQPTENTSETPVPKSTISVSSEHPPASVSSEGPPASFTSEGPLASATPETVPRETTIVSESSTFFSTSPSSSLSEPPATTSEAEIFSPIPNKITCQADSYTTENLLILKITNFSVCDGVKDSRNHPLYTALCRAGKPNFNKDRDLCHVQLISQPEKQEVAVLNVSVQTHLQPKELYEVLKKRWDDLKALGVSNMTYGKESLDKDVEDRFSMPLIITIVCMAAFLLFVAALYGCFHQRFTQRKDQQRLTEELQTVENGYHDNPTLEVMETSSEMQEKKVANLNGELGDSWIVPLDNLTKDDLDQEEEDTHL
ncbi:uncharacterized protein ACOB8E_002140 [Sarcophilus harrisii]